MIFSNSSLCGVGCGRWRLSPSFVHVRARAHVCVCRRRGGKGGGAAGVWYSAKQSYLIGGARTCFYFQKYKIYPRNASKECRQAKTKRKCSRQWQLNTSYCSLKARAVHSSCTSLINFVWNNFFFSFFFGLVFCLNNGGDASSHVLALSRRTGPTKTRPVNERPLLYRKSENEQCVWLDGTLILLQTG